MTQEQTTQENSVPRIVGTLRKETNGALYVRLNVDQRKYFKEGEQVIVEKFE